MMSASHRKRDSREALVRWLRDRSSGGRTSHSGTLDCRSPILDCMPFPRFSIESRQSKSPKILAGNILQRFSVAGARRGLNRIRLQLAIYFRLHRGKCSLKGCIMASREIFVWNEQVLLTLSRTAVSESPAFELVTRSQQRRVASLLSSQKSLATFPPQEIIFAFVPAALE